MKLLCGPCNRMFWDKRHYTQGCFADVVPLEQDKPSLPKAVNPLNNPISSHLSVAEKYMYGCIRVNNK